MCLSTSCVEVSGIIAVKHSGPQGAHSGGAQGIHTKNKSDCNSAPIGERTLFLKLRYSPEDLILFLLHQLPHLLHFQSLSMSLEQGSSKLQPTSQILTSACFFFLNKVHWNTAMFIWLHIVSGFFHTTKAELSGCNKTLWPTKPSIFTHWLFITKVCQHLVCGKFWILLSQKDVTELKKSN